MIEKRVLTAMVEAPLRSASTNQHPLHFGAVLPQIDFGLLGLQFFPLKRSPLIFLTILAGVGKEDPWAAIC
jgi:hypothetical protein